MRFNVQYDPRIDYSALLSKILLAQNKRDIIKRVRIKIKEEEEANETSN